MYTKHLLSSIPGEISPGLLERLQRRRTRGRTSACGRAVVIDARPEPIEWPLSDPAKPLPPELAVYVWWSIGGFVCASMAEVNEVERHRGAVVDQVKQAREHLAQARRTRPARAAAASAQGVDVQLE